MEQVSREQQRAPHFRGRRRQPRRCWRLRRRAERCPPRFIDWARCRYADERARA